MKALLFDFWGTLGFIEHGQDFVAKIAAALKTTKPEYINFVVDTWYKEELTIEEFLHKLSTKFGTVNSDIGSLLLEPKRIVRLYSDVITNLQRLSNESQILLVSDTTPIGRDCINQVGFNNYFSSIHYSFNYGLTKKEGLYAHVIKRIGLDPSECTIVGNSFDSDYKPGIEAGAKAILLDRANLHRGVRKVITLNEL